MHSPQTLIVGSGPAGLILALALLKNGVSVRIIEKDEQHHMGERGPGVMPRTLEIEHFLGVADDVRKAGSGLPTMHVFDPNDPHRIIKSANMVEHVEPTPAFPVTQGVMLGQWRHQAILRKHIEALGGKVELGTALIGIEQDEDGATAKVIKIVSGKEVKEKAKFAYIIGADGAHSTVRKTLGINFVGETREEGKIYIMDARIEGIEGEKDIYLWGEQQKAIVALRHTVEPGLFQTLFTGPEVDFRSLKEGNSIEAAQNELNRIIRRTDLKITDITWQGEWRPNLRMAEHFRVGRVFIIGDAAHAHSPTGGQGLNSSVQDAFNLAWKLSLVLKGHASPALLDTYEIERMPVIAEMLKITTDIYNKFYNEDTQQALRHAEAAANKASSGIGEQWFRGRKLFQLDLNYRWSPVVVDERHKSAAGGSDPYGIAGHDTRAGDRAPDAPGLTALAVGGVKCSATRLFDVFDPSAHTMLTFASAFTVEKARSIIFPLKKLAPGLVRGVLILPSGTSSESAPIADVEAIFEDTEGHAFAGYGLSTDADEPTVVIVRPDGMIGAFARSAAGVDKYFLALYGAA